MLVRFSFCTLWASRWCWEKIFVDLKLFLCLFCRDSGEVQKPISLLSVPKTHTHTHTRRQTHTMMGCWRQHLHMEGRLPWTHSEIGWVTGNKNERGQRKIENWEKWWREAGRQSDVSVIRDKRSHAVKAFGLTCVRAQEGLEWRF